MTWPPASSRARAPRTSDALLPRPRTERKPGFEGYTIEGELQAGGSGARLFLARPSKEKLTAYAERGHVVPEKVVIKAFDRGYGSTLPQIVRQSRALEAAARLAARAGVTAG